MNRSSTTTGVYGGGSVPGNYVKTRTGAVRGEELFSRPDMERPWRSIETQKRATQVVGKEKEIEELTRLCSSLRTELSNSRNDARFLEFALTEKMNSELSAKDKERETLESSLEAFKKEQTIVKESTEHQIRMLKSLHENESAGLKAEAKIATEKCTELSKLYQKQVDEIKEAGAKEVKFVETRFCARVEELTSELRAVRETAKEAEKHHAEQVTEATNLVMRIEADYKERLRGSDQRLDDLRKLHMSALSKERNEKEEALAEKRRVTEKLAVSVADCDEVVQRFKLWNSYILAGLDAFYMHLAAALPDAVVEPVSPEITELPSIYVPRVSLQNPETKVTVQRIAYRLLQLRSMKDLNVLEVTTARGQSCVELHLERVQEKQDRLKSALKEVSDKVAEMDLLSNSILGRLYFFSDNMEFSIANAPSTTAPSLRNVTLVSLSIENGNTLWADDPAAMRPAVTLLSNTIRLKMGEYGGYESYSDSVSMLLAFHDAAAACRFCTECQEWLLRTPWPTSILLNPLCPKERDADKKLLFSGLRVAMAVHAGECCVESTAIPSADGHFRSHYYGRAVSQVVHISSLSQGGQVIVSKPAWALMMQKKHEIDQLTVRELGSFPIVSLNSLTGSQEKQSIDLYQVSSCNLDRRLFKETSKMEVPSVSSLSGLKKCILSTEIEAIDTRRTALADTLALVKEEYTIIQDDLNGLLTKARSTRSTFHLLPPPEMVTQMNELYSVLEQVAVRAEEVCSDMTRITEVLEELVLQSKCLKTYLEQLAEKESKESELLTGIDVSSKRLEGTLKDLEVKYRRDAEKLQSTIFERDQTIRKLYQRIGPGA